MSHRTVDTSHLFDRLNLKTLGRLFINFLAIAYSQDKNANRFVLDACDNSKLTNAIFPKVPQS